MSKKTGLYKFIAFVLAALLSAGVMGCAQKSREDKIILNSEGAGIDYSLVVVSKGDVCSTVIVRCEYYASKEENASYDIEGGLVEKVYVSKGDVVKKGQLLATLTSESAKNEIDDLEYRMNRITILKKSAEADKEDEKSYARLDYERTEQTAKDTEKYEERLAAIDENYRYTLEDYEDQLKILEAQKNTLQKQVKEGKLYAPMAGTITFVKENLEGSRTTRGEKIFTITDSEDGTFIADNNMHAEYFREGDVVEITILSGNSKGVYEITPYRLGESDDLEFVLADSMNDTTIAAGSRGTVTVILEKRENVVNIPKTVTYNTGDRYYVYTLDENGEEVVHWITVGLVGDDTVEVLEGLTEGDRVISYK